MVVTNFLLGLTGAALGVGLYEVCFRWLQKKLPQSGSVVTKKKLDYFDQLIFDAMCAFAGQHGCATRMLICRSVEKRVWWRAIAASRVHRRLRILEGAGLIIRHEEPSMLHFYSFTPEGWKLV